MTTVKHLRKVLIPPAPKSHLKNLKTSDIIKAIKKVDKEYQKIGTHKHFLRISPSHS